MQNGINDQHARTPTQFMDSWNAGVCGEHEKHEMNFRNMHLGGMRLRIWLLLSFCGKAKPSMYAV